MSKNSVITVPQLFGMLFISRMIVNITYNPYMASTGDVIDHLLSAGIAYLLTFLLVIPVYLLYRRRPGMNLADNAYFLVGKPVAIAVVVVYALYFLLVSCYTLSLFDSFVTNVMSPKIPILMLSIAIVITACYGAFKGIEALARSSGIILIGVCIALIFLLCALFPEIEPENIPPFLYDGPQSMINGTFFMISRTSCIPVMAMLLPLVKGNVKKGIFMWNTATYLVIAAMIFTIVGCLGDYLKTQVFPVYAATSIAEIGMFKRLDALFLGIWTTGLFVKMALFIYLISACATRIWGKKAGKITILSAGAVIVAASVLLVESRDFSRVVYDWRFLIPCTLLVSLVIPIVLLIVDSIKKRKEGE